MKELEVVMWCPKCAAEKARVLRAQAKNEGVYVHVTEPESMTGVKQCPDCETLLVGQR